MQPLDRGCPAALVDRPPAHVQSPGEFRPQGGVVQPVGGHGMGVQLPRIQGRPAAVRAHGGVLDQHVGVPLRVAFAAGPVIEGGGGDTASAEPVDAVVAAADPDRLLLEPAQHGSDGHMAGGLNFRPHFRVTSGRQQTHTFRIRKRQIKGRHRASIRLPTCLQASV
jgi:hypothetical protein